jgi:hypothetical protein
MDPARETLPACRVTKSVTVLHSGTTLWHMVPAVVLRTSQSRAQFEVGCVRRWPRIAPRTFPLRPRPELAILRLSHLSRVGGGFRAGAVMIVTRRANRQADL